MLRKFLVQATAHLILKLVYQSDEGTDSVIDELAEKAWGNRTLLSPCLGNGNLVPDRSLS